MRWLLSVGAVIGLASLADAACCYFSAKNADILQPAQKVFLTWDPQTKSETFTVQPKFEGNALDFGMVIPTPSQPKLHEMPRDYFKHLAVYTILKKREFPHSKLLPRNIYKRGALGAPVAKSAAFKDGKAAGEDRRPTVVVLEAGVVGSLDYKIISAERADDLYDWLKTHKYHYAGDEATLNFYVQKKWLFTVMKIDTMQMKRNKDGSFAGEVTPTRFQFTSDKLIYPLKITQLSVKDKTEALFYVQAPTKMDLEGDLSYQHTWIPMVQAGSGCVGVKAGGADKWLQAAAQQIPQLLQRGNQLGFRFIPGQRPLPNSKGHIPTTMEWARKLTADDVKMFKGEGPYAEKVPNVDEGFTQADIKDPKRAEAIYKVIRARLARAQQERPDGYLVREAPAEDVRALQQLAGHLQSGLFITKFRKIFAKDEMNADLTLLAARLGDNQDNSEYEEILPVSPP